MEDSRSGSLGQQCLAALQVALPWLLRGHLAFFYLYGWYYQWSHRLSGSLIQDPFLPNNMAAADPSHRFVHVWPSLPFFDALHALVQSKFSWTFRKLEPTIRRALLLGGIACYGLELACPFWTRRTRANADMNCGAFETTHEQRDAVDYRLVHEPVRRTRIVQASDICLWARFSSKDPSTACWVSS